MFGSQGLTVTLEQDVVNHAAGEMWWSLFTSALTGPLPTGSAGDVDGQFLPRRCGLRRRDSVGGAPLAAVTSPLLKTTRRLGRRHHHGDAPPSSRVDDRLTLSASGAACTLMSLSTWWLSEALLWSCTMAEVRLLALWP